MRRNSKGFTPIAILLLVFILVGGSIYFLRTNKKNILPPPTPSPSEFVRITASPAASFGEWKTYTDSELGLEFKYPSNWSVNTDPEGHGRLYLDSMPFVFKQSENPVPILFWPDTISSTVSESVKWISQSLAPQSIKKADMTIGGKKAVQISGVVRDDLMNAGAYGKYTFIQLAPTKVLGIFFEELNDRSKETIYDQLIPTINFLN